MCAVDWTVLFVCVCMFLLACTCAEIDDYLADDGAGAGSGAGSGGDGADDGGGADGGGADDEYDEF